MTNIRTILALFTLAAAGQIHASTFFFSTPSGSTDLANNPISASTVFVVNGNTLEITLENIEANPIDDGAVLDALSFQLNNQAIPTGASISISESLTEAITISSSGSFRTESDCNGSSTSGCSTYETWTMTNAVTGSATDSTVKIDLCAEANTAVGCPSSGSPAYSGNDGIIGGPNTSSKYSSGIKTNAFNPYIFEEASFTLTLPTGDDWNLAQDNYTNLIFGFGDSGDFNAIDGVTPEPSTFGLMAFALAFGFAVYRRRRHLAPR